MHKLMKNFKLNLFTCIELIFAFTVNTIVISLNLGYSAPAYVKKEVPFEVYIFNVFTYLALFVTSIGIIGIQLIQIYRRRSEIGLRKAVGAKDADIIILILKDTLLLIIIPAISGCILGAILSCILPMEKVLHVVNKINLKLFLYCSITIILFAIFSGMLPAIKAVKMNPVDALGKRLTYYRKKAGKMYSACFFLVSFTVILGGFYINYKLEAEYKTDVINTTGAPPATTEEAPGFSFQSAGGNITLSDTLKGKSYCLVIYDVKCGVSPMVFGDLSKLIELGKIKASDIYAIETDTIESDNTFDDVKDFMSSNELSLTPFIDYKKSTKWAFNAHTVPAVYIIGENGVINARIIGWSENAKDYLMKRISEMNK